MNDLELALVILLKNREYFASGFSGDRAEGLNKLIVIELDVESLIEYKKAVIGIPYANDYDCLEYGDPKRMKTFLANQPDLISLIINNEDHKDILNWYEKWSKAHPDLTSLRKRRDNFLFDIEPTKGWLEKITTALVENNLYKTTLYVMQFGEYLQEKYPDATLENIGSKIDGYTVFHKRTLPDLKIVFDLYNGVGTCTQNSHRNLDAISGIVKSNKRKHVELQNISNLYKTINAGLSSFCGLLDSHRYGEKISEYNTSSENIESEQEKQARLFVEHDLIPNTASRKKIEEAIDELRIYGEKSTTDLAMKKVAQTLSVDLRTKCDKYFSVPEKTKEKTNDFKKDVGLTIKQSTLSQNGSSEIKTILKNILTVVLNVVTIGLYSRIKTGKWEILPEKPIETKLIDKIKETAKRIKPNKTCKKDKLKQERFHPILD